MRISAILLAGCFLVALASCLCAGESTATNLLRNAEFEEWATYSPSPHLDPKRIPKIEEGQGPVWWAPNIAPSELQKDPNFPVKSSFGRDSTIKHGGAASLRIINGLTTDIGWVSTPLLDVLPNQRYRLSIWYRAENVQNNPDHAFGVCIGLDQGQAADFWGTRKGDFVKPKMNTGTFEWRRLDVYFRTLPTTGKLSFSLQLRRASGTVWFDDAELVPVDDTTTSP